jgi:citrate synthase
MTRNWLTAEQAARRLGVKLPTLYAYVSRGVLGRTTADDGRTSRFNAAEVDRLARRGRPRRDSRPMGTVDVSLATSITSIQGERLLYRGHDATALASLASFEAVAELLWSGELPEHPAWPEAGVEGPVARAVARALPPGAPPAERFAAVTAALACAHPLRVDLRPSAVASHARTLLTTFVDALPPLSASDLASRPRGKNVAARLWPRLSPLPSTAARIAALDSALVLLADHELATSTFAARVAASTRADPFAVVLAGLGAAIGPLHGKAPLAAHQMLVDAASAPAPEQAVARVLSRSGSLPGYGHPVYRSADPRAQHLLKVLGPLLSKRDQAVLDSVTAAASASGSAQPNVDFALAALAFGTQMQLGATDAIFVFARTAGWIAHALEEYAEEPLRFRARAIYIGPVRREPAPDGSGEL